MTERRACRPANQPRGTQRYRAIRREDEDALTQAIIQFASQYGRYGYRRITALLYSFLLATLERWRFRIAPFTRRGFWNKPSHRKTLTLTVQCFIGVVMGSSST